MLQCNIKNNNGLILMVSLWILAIISLLSLGLAHRVIISLKLVKFQRDRIKSLYIAKAAAQKAISVLEKDLESSEQDALNEFWSVGYDKDSDSRESIFKDTEIGDGSFTISYIFDDSISESPKYFYGMLDEERKININKASYDLLKTLFEIIGFIDADSLANNIIYWRGDAAPEIEDVYYGSLEVPYAARKAPFECIEELFLVKGFRESSDFIKKCERYLTVYTKGQININTAAREVIKAVFIALKSDEEEDVRGRPGLADDLVNWIIDYRAGIDDEVATEDDILITRDIKTQLLYVFRDDNEVNWINEFFDTDYNSYFTESSNLFRIEVAAKLNNSKILKKLSAVIDRSQKGQPKIKYWHEE